VFDLIPSWFVYHWYRYRPSHSVRLLDLAESMVRAEGMSHRRLDGRSTLRQRARAVKDYQEQPAVFVLLISTLAGGLGLNLTAADVVIIFDPVRIHPIDIYHWPFLDCSHFLCLDQQNWNPAHDLQAQDRAWRIGSKKDVQVYR
jgi:SNF2 family DNA or RNA helicase